MFDKHCDISQVKLYKGALLLCLINIVTYHSVTFRKKKLYYYVR